MATRAMNENEFIICFEVDASWLRQINPVRIYSTTTCYGMVSHYWGLGQEGRWQAPRRQKLDGDTVRIFSTWEEAHQWAIEVATMKERRKYADAKRATEMRETIEAFIPADCTIPD